MPKRDLPTSVRLPRELKQWLSSYSQEQRRSRNGLVVWILEQYRKHAEFIEKKK